MLKGGRIKKKYSGVGAQDKTRRNLQWDEAKILNKNKNKNPTTCECQVVEETMAQHRETPAHPLEGLASLQLGSTVCFWELIC